MASYLVKMFMGNGKNPEEPNKNTKLKPANNKSIDSGSGDYNHEPVPKIDIDTVEKSLIKQENSTQKLLTSLDHEIAKSKVDIGDLNNILCNAEEDFPKRSKKLKNLETELKAQIDLVAAEMNKLEKQGEKHDSKLKEIEEKIDSWQLVINKAKENHVQDLWDANLVQ